MCPRGNLHKCCYVVSRQQSRIFDTPGAIHGFSLMPRLRFDETKLLLPRRTITPRTFRVGVGQSILVGSVLSIDIIETSGTTLYVTIWMSNSATTFMGKVS